MEKLKKYEIETIVDYISNYIIRVVIAKETESSEDAASMHGSRDALVNHLMVMFGEEEIEEVKKPIYDGLKCPDCDGEMVSRKSQYGTFWGCKKYPKCKGTRDSEGRTKEEVRIAREKEREKPEPIDEHYRFGKN